MQGIIHPEHREFYRRLAQIGKPDRIFFANIYFVIAHAVGKCSFSGSAQNCHRLKRINPRTIVNGSLYFELAEGATYCATKQTKQAQVKNMNGMSIQTEQLLRK